jgi:phosphatidylserine/phosphatidylglycerophosphate/cardiolipin synthase-like enzyme
MQALKRAADRGAKVRIYLDGTQFAEREPTRVFQELAQTPGVEIRVKREISAFMHLKSHEIDGQLLRTGAANFSASGLKRQDNDLIVLKDGQAAAKFKHVFEARFASGKNFWKFLLPIERVDMLILVRNETIAAFDARVQIVKQFSALGGFQPKRKLRDLDGLWVKIDAVQIMGENFAVHLARVNLISEGHEAFGDTLIFGGKIIKGRN